jgi:hypothetical protein
VDFLFIDADHSYDGIQGDWEAWSQYIATNGIVALHDSFNCNNIGSEIYTREVILNDARFRYLERVDTLTVLQRK